MSRTRNLALVVAVMLVAIPSSSAASPPAPVAAPVGGIVTPQGPFVAPPPPVAGATVHLKTSVCNQSVSVTLKAQSQGGLGLDIISDGAPGSSGFHFPDGQDPFSGLLYASNWLHVNFLVPGLHYTFTFASSDCPASDGLYVANATTISLTVT